MFSGLHRGLRPSSCSTAAVDPFGLCLCPCVSPLSFSNLQIHESPPMVSLPVCRLCRLCRALHHAELHEDHGIGRRLYHDGLCLRRHGGPFDPRGRQTGGWASHRGDRFRFSPLCLFWRLLPRLLETSRLLPSADRLSHVPDHRGHHGYPPLGFIHLHLPLRPLRGLS